MTLSDQSRGAMNQIGGGIYASGLVALPEHPLRGGRRSNFLWKFIENNWH